MPIWLLWPDLEIELLVAGDKDEEKHQQYRIKSYQLTVTSTQLAIKDKSEYLIRPSPHNAQKMTLQMIENLVARQQPIGQVIFFICGFRLWPTIKMMHKWLPLLFDNSSSSGAMWTVKHRLIDIAMIAQAVERWTSTIVSYRMHEHIPFLKAWQTMPWPQFTVAYYNIQAIDLLQYFRLHVFRTLLSSTAVREQRVRHPLPILDLKLQKVHDLFLDVELSGLQVGVHRPLEVAYHVFNERYQLVSTADVVLTVEHANVLAKMDDWSRKQHMASNLIDVVLHGKNLSCQPRRIQGACDISIAEARIVHALSDFKPLVPCGLSIWFDIWHVSEWMSQFVALFATRPDSVANDYLYFDIAVLLECCRWFSAELYLHRPDPILPEHRAHNDVQSAIILCQYLKHHLFDVKGHDLFQHALPIMMHAKLVAVPDLRRL